MTDLQRLGLSSVEAEGLGLVAKKRRVADKREGLSLKAGAINKA